MTIGYKLVTQDYTTHGGMKWEIGKTNQALTEGTQMCSSQVLHYYEAPLLAVLLNPLHADIQNPRMLVIECSEKIAGDGLKAACKKQTPVEEIRLPEITTTQRVAFALECALVIYRKTSFVRWAKDWLSGVDRTLGSAHDAYTQAADDARAAAHDAYAKSAPAPDAAAYAAAAAVAEDAAYAAPAPDAAAYAAAAAADYARTAADAAAITIDFILIIEEVLKKGY